jgi:hypothetical protein
MSVASPDKNKEAKMNITEFKTQLEKSYAKYFTNSKIKIQNNCLGEGFNISCYLVNNIDEAINRIIQNDMFNISFEIITQTDNSNYFKPKITTLAELPQGLVLNIWHKSYITKPDNKYYVYGRKYLNYRKQKGTAEKILIILDKYFSMLNSELKKEIQNNNIHDNFIELLKTKLI